MVQHGGAVDGAVREVFEQCCDGGARVQYRTVVLEKIDRGDLEHDRWLVFSGDECVDTIAVDAFCSASELQRWLDALIDGGDSVGLCPTCPLQSGQSLPGD